MPIYEFQCPNCGKRLEKFMRLSDPDPSECPYCHTEGLQRLVSAAGFRLSGGGWYETDFKSKNETQRNLNKEDAPAADAKPAKENTSSAQKTTTKPSSDKQG